MLAVDSNMRKLITKAKRFAKTAASILVYGEPGTGKESLSHAPHNASQMYTVYGKIYVSFRDFFVDSELLVNVVVNIFEDIFVHYPAIAHLLRH